MAESEDDAGPVTTQEEADRITSDVLSEEKIKEYKTAFAIFDKDGSNSIEAHELKEVLVSLGKNPTDEEVESMIAKVDDNDNGKIEFEEFIQLMEDEERSFKTEDLMRQAFGVLDPEGMGYLTVERLKQIVTDFGIEITDEEIAEMMDEADPNGTGRVEYNGLVGLMSTENETLATAYKKRERIEEIKREEIAKQEAERVELEQQARDNTEDTEDQAEHIPDMEEIASQFDNEQYDQFSRQIPVGGRVLKRPGKRLPMSTTRLRYLQRKNKSLSADCSIGGSMLSLNDTTEQDTRSLHRAEFRTYFKPRSDDWLGTIQDERHTFESKFQSHQPRQYKHVESRLLDPKYYLKKTKGVDEQIRNGFEPAHLRSISVDFDNEPKNLRKMKSRTSKCSDTLSTTNGSTASPPKVVPQNYAERAQKEKLFKETKLYYAVWRSAFTRAIERLRENKKMKAIQLNTPDLLKEEAIRAEKAKKQQGIRARQKPRLSVISPTLQTTQNNTTTQKTRIALNRGSYADMFKKRENIEEKVLDKKEEQTHFVTPRKPRLEPLQKRGIVITKSALNRRTMKIPVQS